MWVYTSLMIVLLTDFGGRDPYVGQMHLRLAEMAPQTRVVDLFHDLPSFMVDAAAYLIPAYCRHVPIGAIVVAVVDPGVGGTRRAVSVEADGRFYIGPDNGLFEFVARRANRCVSHELPIPDDVSATFHGRDVFVPAAAAFARGESLSLTPLTLSRFPEWPDEGMKIIYMDHYGNAITGVRAASWHQTLVIGGHTLTRARTFSERPLGEPFFYENANGLIEIAAYARSAAAVLKLKLADPFTLI